MASLMAQTVKEAAHNMGDEGSTPGLGRFPGEGHGNPCQYSCLENPHGQRSVVGYNPWDLKEWDTTERLSIVQQNIFIEARISLPNSSDKKY